MNDTCFEVEGMREEDLSSWRQGKNIFLQLDMFDPSPEAKLLSDLEIVKQEILSELPVGYNRRRDDLRARIALKKDYFGAFSGSHFTAVLGGRPRNLRVPKSFVPLGPDQVVLQGPPGGDETTVRRV